jgi:hypothetical protein
MKLTDTTLTVRQAYLAMFEFLRRHYERGPTDEIGGLLGSLSLLSDGKPADEAMLSDFETAVGAVLAVEASQEGYRAVDLNLGSGGKA